MRIGEGIWALALGALLSVGCSDSPTAAPQPQEGVNTSPATGTDTSDHFPGPADPMPGAALYAAVMNGSQQVPANSSLASGSASINLTADGSGLVYAITVTNIMGVTAAHIHSGAPGEAGAPVVDLFVGGPTGPYNGLLIQGALRADQLHGALAGMTLEELVALIESGRAYVNVHTAGYPDGEIRGQLRAVPADGVSGGES